MNKPSLPAIWNDAKKALAIVTTITEAKAVRGKAITIQVWAHQAKDPELMGRAVQARMWAERRIGELIEEQRTAGTLAKGMKGKAGPGRGKRGSTGDPRFKETPSLANQGVDKHLADRGRKAWAMPEGKFRTKVAKTQKIAVATTMQLAEVIKEARAERHENKKERRAQREQALATKIQALPKKKYGVILADPEWRWEPWSQKGLDATSADNHYPTSALSEIKARDVPSIAADDSVLFLWATVPMLPQALEVMKAWEFNYVSSFVWVKDRAGTGYWNRSKHELLLIGTRGKIPAPAEGSQWESVINAPRGRHSEKPDAVYELIEAYFPNLPKIELNARKEREGFDSWGFEAPLAVAAE